MADTPPAVFVLAGPNGAGKTTASRTILAETLRVMTFVNADVIARGLAGFEPDSAAVEASRIMLRRLHTLAEQRADFAFETTLAARGYAGGLRDLRSSGYAVHLVYFWLESADLAVARVAHRVSGGGHDVPEATVRQRCRRSVQNLLRLYCPLVSTWRVYDNTLIAAPRLVAWVDEAGTVTIVLDPVRQQMHRELTA
jgi:predicted ABC-type ATPase